MDQQKSFQEVANIEKQLMTVISTKGILHGEFLHLYREIRTEYEKILLNSDQMVELQEIEYILWKLHYKLIDEFRKRLRLLSFKAENIKDDTLSENTNSKNNSDEQVKEFKSFLSEATEFYADLIVKFRKSCGLPPEIFLKSRSGGSLIIEPTKLHECQCTCHRLLICLGDIARYIEFVKKRNACDWSTAAKYYIEATRSWPDSGNPHNQLALLATYVGDSFLALYHCVRSLAVKEPFPDGWRNLVLVLEENRSTEFQMLSSEMLLDFSDPSRRISLQNTSSERNTLEDIGRNISELWPVLVRTLGFLLTRSSLEEFPCALATALHYLEALFALDDSQLANALESYKHMDSSRRGPYRALQLVSTFIFIVHNLTENPENNQVSSFTPLAFATIFICMGRLTERCMRGNPNNICPLLPALVVFLEWLVGALDAAEAHHTDEKVTNAKSYFVRTLVDLLDRLDQNSRATAPEYIALWEDHELMGFHSLAPLHVTMDFLTHQECAGDFRSGNQLRFRRIVHAAKRIINRSKEVSSDSVKTEKHFYNSEAKETDEREDKISLPEKTENDSVLNPQTTMDEEEVILFKPITRLNSAPLYIKKEKNDLLRPQGMEAQETICDEILRRSASLSVSGQNRSGPPSLSAWVLNPESGREKVPKKFNKQMLSPIDEIASMSEFSGLSINEPKDSELPMDHITTSPTYNMPIPSAPSLPEDGILGAAPISAFANSRPMMGFVNGVSGLVDGYPPFTGMSSSEWLYHYRNSQNVTNPGNRYFYDPIYGHLRSDEVTSFDLCDQWGNQIVSNPMMYVGRPQLYPNSSSVVYGGEDQSVDTLFLDYQRPFPYVCGVGTTELGSDNQSPLLQYLKEKERQMQPGSQLRGPPTFMRN